MLKFFTTPVNNFLATFVNNQLTSLADAQTGLLWGLKSEIPKLQNTVSRIQAVLPDAEKQSGRNHPVQLWLRRQDEVVYDAEDLLDDFSTEVRQREQMDGNRVLNELSLFFSPSNQLAYAVRMANQIKAIQSNLDEIDQERKEFNLETRPVKAWRETHSSVPDVVVGREEDKEKIKDMLLQSNYNEKVAVVPIIGFPGLGKTTLAKLIYNDDAIESHFACRVWVWVSENFDRKLLVKKILESITKREVGDLALTTLQDLLRQEIKNKKILLVLDDVWNEDREEWDSFWSLFTSYPAKGSRIVVTTREMSVAKITATESIVPHVLKGLSGPESWSLFQKMAFKEEVAPGPKYVEIGEAVVRKCGGVPLAIRTIGGLLQFKETESKWEAIRDEQPLLSLDLPGGQEVGILTRTLKLSYDNLPSNLRRCFAYCSLFPKDHKIDVKMLVQLWMAQGYIINSGQSSLLGDVGVELFKNLLWRSFFQEVTKDAYGNLESCKMHDLMHDLAVAVAGEEIIHLNASNLTSALLNSGDVLLSSGKVVKLEKIRHLSIDFENRQDIKACQIPILLAKATRLRTFLIINVYSGVVELQGSCEEIFPKMTRLRVLGLRGANMESFSSIIHKLKHLRYLDLSENYKMETLPKEITRLVNLQVLSLYACTQLRLLPVGIEKLSNLVCLDLLVCVSLSCIPAGIGNLSFLRELPYFVVAEAAAATAAGLGELKSLNNLSGSLTIARLERVKDKSEAEAANLKEKSQLQCLVLRWSGDDYDNNMGGRRCDRDPDGERSVLEALQPHPNLKEIQLWDYSGTSIPTTSSSCCFSSLRNLVRIQLIKCMNLRSLPSLDPFVSLRELWLFNLESLEYVQSETVAASSSSQFLSSLQSLHIKDCSNLIGWSPTNTNTQVPLLPRVSNLWISGCPKMVSVPRFLVNFHQVVLKGVSSELLSALGASLISPPQPHPQRFHHLFLIGVKGDLPPGLMPQLTSLQILRIYDCNNLTTLSPSILRHLHSLQELRIDNCEVLELDDCDYGSNGDDDNNNNTQPPPRVLPSLRIFAVSEVPKLVTLPNWLQHSSDLQQLAIGWCDNLESLPSWLTKLTALESLIVYDCELLRGRCRSNKAEDWPNISHIPNIQIAHHRYVQQNGRYLGMGQEEEVEEAEEDEEQQQQQQGSSHTQF